MDPSSLHCPHTCCFIFVTQVSIPGHCWATNDTILLWLRLKSLQEWLPYSSSLYARCLALFIYVAVGHMDASSPITATVVASNFESELTFFVGYNVLYLNPSILLDWGSRVIQFGSLIHVHHVPYMQGVWQPSYTLVLWMGDGSIITSFPPPTLFF